MKLINIKNLCDFNITSSKLRKIEFNCGEDKTDLDLNIYLKKNALNHSRSGFSSTYIAIYNSENIVGYYTISACSIQFDALVIFCQPIFLATKCPLLNKALFVSQNYPYAI